MARTVVAVSMLFLASICIHSAFRHVNKWRADTVAEMIESIRDLCCAAVFILVAILVVLL